MIFWHPHITWTVNWILQICIFFASPISVWGSPSTKKLRTYFMVIFCCCWGLAISITCVIAAGGTNGLCAGSSLDDGAWSFTLQPVNLSIYVCKHNQITISEMYDHQFVYYKNSDNTFWDNGFKLQVWYRIWHFADDCNNYCSNMLSWLFFSEVKNNWDSVITTIY